ncbi:hypothetical protein PSTEL_11555 [Paenibacillus stellifer]|uniref:ABC transporter permease n=1 Tax=Paenibacillus stellifer TaxID=169760 RepID=A0A089LPZ8_9BACL|nr:ABC-2 family transporter protein [Paenibacillus stellifer]AIQ63621.1 hypothetical protein PSTEL_11555 [Paenibacillus stellifer]
MRKYWEIMKGQIKLDTAYAAWYWSSTASTILKLLVVYAFWHAVYENRTTVGAVPLDTMLTYVVLAMMLGEYVSGVGNQLASSVRDGSVAVELMKPYNLLDKLVALDLGRKITAIIRETIPMLVLAFLFLHINGPVSAGAGLLFILSSVLGILIGSQLDLIIGIAAFYLDYVWGLRTMRDAIISFFSGALVPLTLFPGWLQTVGYFLPFRSMVHVPVAIYTGQITGTDALLAMGVQVCWLAGIFAGIRMIWRIALKRVTIFGG